MGIASAVHPDIPSTELDQLCKDYLGRLQVSEAEQQRIAVATSQQSDDLTGHWTQERHVRITSSYFGEVCKCRTSFAPLTIHLLYVQCRETPQMRYGRVNKPQAREHYTLYLKSHHHPEASVSTTGIHVDLKV